MSDESPFAQALRLSVVREFHAKKVRKYVEKQVQHINANRQLAEGIRFLFDPACDPSPDTPLEQLIEQRRSVEREIRWLEAVVTELRHRRVKVKEIEDYAFEMLGKPPLDD